MTDILQEIQTLQFKDKGKAEALLLSFIRQNFPFDIASVSLRPSAVSLNSFNGIMTLNDGKRFFFKSHTEFDTIINEYYHAELLANAGYPIIQPIFKSTDVGKQFLVYELIESQSVFDIAWELENSPNPDERPIWGMLESAQYAADDMLFELYKKTFQKDVNTENAPIHQLFYHRLTGGRLKRFYGLQESTKGFKVDDVAISMEALWNAKWVINGNSYDKSLNDLVVRATELLRPQRSGPAIIGHGDAHNGNVFLIVEENQPKLYYFDPAFAGLHHPVLDLVKPMFHNVFAMWMYYPKEIAHRLKVDISYSRGEIRMNHDYRPHAIRNLFWRSKVDKTLIPTLSLLKEAGALPSSWIDFFRSALACCPLLTMNLADLSRFPPEISLLGFAMTLEMGFENNNFITAELASIASRV